MRKGIPWLLIVLLSVMLLCGCSGNLENKRNSYVDARGNIIEYAFSELPDGIYAQSHNTKNYHKLFSYGIEDYAGLAEKDDPTRYLWWSETDAKYDYDEIIPVLYAGDSLILKYESTDELPEVITLERYKDRGYTIGTHLYREDTDGNAYYFDGADRSEWCEASAFAKGFVSLGLTEHVVLRSIDKKSCSGFSLNPHLNVLTGLEKDEALLLEFYSGTYLQVYEVPADTRILQSDRVIQLSDHPYRETENGYFIVQLPEDMPKGYYYINDLGLIYYETDQRTWKNPVVYKVRYELSGGIGNTGGLAEYRSEDPDHYAKELMPDPVREGYTFTGWKDALGRLYEGNEVVIPNGSTGEMTFTASWESVTDLSDEAERNITESVLRQ